MSNTALNAAQAVARARTFTQYGHNECLRFVADAYSNGTLPYTRILSALDGWKATQSKRFDRNIPFGVPVYWNSPYQPNGHVAISVGGGRVRSTDQPANGQVAEVAVTDLETGPWKLQYLGWGLDFCGDLITGVTVPAAPVGHPNITVANIRPGFSNPDVETYNRLLWAAQGPMYKLGHTLMWFRGKASTYDAASEQVTYDTYVNAKGALGTPPSRPCWPGPDLIRAIGGTPV